MIEYTVQVTPHATTWYLNGERHREDGPAVEDDEGYKAWYLNGKRHRTDGPAYEETDGYKEWYLNGVKVTQADVMQTKEMTMAELEATLGSQSQGD